MIITNLKTNMKKEINVWDFTPRQLNSITAFYDDHEAYDIHRVK